MKERPTVDVIRLASDKGRLARSKERHEICHVLLPHEMFGAPKTNRTSDLPLRRGLLYPLSYRGVRGHFSVKSAPACSLILKENQWLSGC